MKNGFRRWLRRALLALGLFVLTAGALAKADGLEVHFLNVGRNDGILIRCDGEDVFIDSGTVTYGRVSVDYMRGVGVASLKYYIGTHGHLDHVGGAPRVMAAFPPGEVLQPYYGVGNLIRSYASTEEEKRVTAQATYRDLRWGDQVSVGKATITCLGPVHIYPAHHKSTAENGNSLILRLQYGNVRFLLTGDATYNSLMDAHAVDPGCLRADVYKNAHHDGVTRNDILDMINPSYTVFSTVKGAMPVSSYTTRLHEMGSRVLATTDNHCGNIVMTTDGNTISVRRTQYAASSLRLNKDSLELYEGQRASLSASLQPGGFWKNGLHFSSDNPAVATVNAAGKVTAVRSGETIIRVEETGSGLSAQCRVRVSPATLTLKKTELTVKQNSTLSVGYSIQPSGTKTTVRWTSNNPAVATVDDRGRVTGVYPGSAAIFAAMPSGQVCRANVTVTPVAVTSIKVTPSSLKATIGERRQLIAKVAPGRATFQGVTWSSADPSIATVSADGTVYAAGVGRTTVTATAHNGKSRAVAVTVKPVYVKKLTITGDANDLVGGLPGKNQARLGYAIEPAEATIQAVSWSSSNPKVASVDENGLVTAHKAGKTNIMVRATDGSGRVARMQIRVLANELKLSKIDAPQGRLTAAAKQMRYTPQGLEITLYYANMTGETQMTPALGTLYVVLPDGARVPAMVVDMRQTALKKGASRTVRLVVPAPLDARLENLDLALCGAEIRPQ